MSDQPKEEGYDIPLQLPENYNPDPFHGKTIEQMIFKAISDKARDERNERIMRRFYENRNKTK